MVAGLLVTLAATTFVATLLWEEARSTEKVLKAGPIAKTGNALTPSKSGRPQTILLVGDDHRYVTGADGKPKESKDPTRSDTMILVRLDPKANATTMLSLPRDLLVTRPGGTTPQKLNGSYTDGPEGLIKVLGGMLGTPDEPFRIHHYVSIRFMAFAKAVNTFDCFYSDIDRRYFNDNNPPVGGGGRYAEIDVAAGYQLLCGLDSLAYVRFRHLDSDLVREARQTNYIAEARGQIKASKLVSDHDDLLRAIRPHMETDRMSARELLRIVGLAVNVTDMPTQRVPIEVSFTPGGDVQATPDALKAASRAFLHPGRVPGEAGRKAAAAKDRAKSGTRDRRRVKRKKGAAPTTVTADPEAAKAVVARDVAPDVRGWPVLYPKLIAKRASYPEGNSRGYDIAAKDGTFPWQGYRIVARLGEAAAGQYYGIQGTSWRDPPVLKLADDEESLGGRRFLVQYDGKRIRRMMLRTSYGSYWVTNSLNNQLANDEMRAIAKSLVRFDR